MAVFTSPFILLRSVFPTLLFEWLAVAPSNVFDALGDVRMTSALSMCEISSHMSNRIASRAIVSFTTALSLLIYVIGTLAITADSKKHFTIFHLKLSRGYFAALRGNNLCYLSLEITTFINGSRMIIIFCVLSLLYFTNANSNSEVLSVTAALLRIYKENWEPPQSEKKLLI